LRFTKGFEVYEWQERWPRMSGRLLAEAPKHEESLRPSALNVNCSFVQLISPKVECRTTTECRIMEDSLGRDSLTRSLRKLAHYRLAVYLLEEEATTLWREPTVKLQ
jgi:hypothetical protein